MYAGEQPLFAQPSLVKKKKKKRKTIKDILPLTMVSQILVTLK